MLSLRADSRSAIDKDALGAHDRRKVGELRPR
jgi:hypothetical protein